RRDFVDRSPDVASDARRRVEENDAILGGEERRLVAAVGDPVEVPLHSSHVVALIIQGGADRRPGNRRVVRQGGGDVCAGSWRCHEYLLVCISTSDACASIIDPCV